MGGYDLREGQDTEFLTFCEKCEEVGRTRSKLTKIGIVSEYFRTLLDEDLRVASTFLAGKILPPSSEDIELNVGYSMIWKTVAQFYGLNDGDLSRYYLKHGDLGSSLLDFLMSENKPRQNTTLLGESLLTLQDIKLAFIDLAKVSGKRSSEKKQKIIDRMLFAIRDPVEAKYLIRIMSGEMRIGFVEGLVEESITKSFDQPLANVRTANLVTGDIGRVAVLAKHSRLEEAQLELFHPTNFMLADSAESAEALHAGFSEFPVLSNFKYDGIRAQVHLGDDKVKIFSRNLEDITLYFPEIEDGVRGVGQTLLVLDGEIVPFKEGSPLSFQALQQRLRRLERAENEIPIKYFVFDILFKERPMINLPLSRRLEALQSLSFNKVIAEAERRFVSTPEEIQSMFDESKSLGYEGLVVKNLSSPYTPGWRGKNWMKLKKELDTLDVVIVAAELGHGKRARVISDYTFAVRDGAELKVVGKAYSGLTDAEISEMTDNLKQITIEDYGYRRTVKPQIVLEVAFDAIQESNRHNSGYALRFPRIKRIRTDKSVSQIDTLERVKKIYEGQVVKY